MKKPTTTHSDSAGEAVLLVLCSCPGGDEQVARQIAAALAERRLAACVHIIPGLPALFRWEGRLEQQAECLLLAKTTRAAYPRLEQEVLAMHPYNVPEIIAIPLARGLESYLSWVRDNTLADTPDSPADLNRDSPAAPGTIT